MALAGVVAMIIYGCMTRVGGRVWLTSGQTPPAQCGEPWVASRAALIIAITLVHLRIPSRSSEITDLVIVLAMAGVLKLTVPHPTSIVFLED